MSVIGNPITIGSSGSGSNAYIVGVIVGVTNANSYTTLADTVAEADPEYFTYSTSSFTCHKSGTYSVTIGIKGCYNSSGNRIDGSIRTVKNSAVLQAVSSNSTQYSTATYSVTLAENDVLYVMARNNTSSANIEPCFALIKTT